MVSEEYVQKTIKYSSLIVLVLQNTSLILFMKFAMAGERTKFIKAIAVFYGEIFKLFASIVMCCFANGSVRKGISEIYTECVRNRKDFVKVFIPAMLLTLQNILIYIAVDNLRSPTFMVAYQFKILVTVLSTVVVLKRPLNVIQWIALFGLFAGIAIVQYDEKVNSSRNITEIPKTEEENYIIGFLSLVIACVLSGISGIYFEKMLKGSCVSLWIRNFQLAGPSIFFSFLFALGNDYSMMLKDGFNPLSVSSNMIQGFDWAVWITVLISALGGLFVAFVIRFCDNILKAFATSLSIILNCGLSYFLFSFHPLLLFLLGTCLVMGSIFSYSLFPYQSKPTDLEHKIANEGEDEEDNGKKYR